MINPAPIYLELDTKREIAYTIGSALALRENGFNVRALMERAEDAPAGEQSYRIYPDAVVAWLAACLLREARNTGDVLDAEWVKDQVDTEAKLLAACQAINGAVIRYYGEKRTGEAKPQAQARRRGAKASR